MARSRASSTVEARQLTRPGSRHRIECGFRARPDRLPSRSIVAPLRTARLSVVLGERDNQSSRRWNGHACHAGALCACSAGPGSPTRLGALASVVDASSVRRPRSPTALTIRPSSREPDQVGEYSSPFEAEGQAIDRRRSPVARRRRPRIHLVGLELVRWRRAPSTTRRRTELAAHQPARAHRGAANTDASAIAASSSRRARLPDELLPVTSGTSPDSTSTSPTSPGVAQRGANCVTGPRGTLQRETAAVAQTPARLRSPVSTRRRRAGAGTVPLSSVRALSQASTVADRSPAQRWRIAGCASGMRVARPAARTTPRPARRRLGT